MQVIVDQHVKSLGESVFLRLEEEIISGKLKKGDLLTEISLSKRMGVSRTPLRTAIQTLAEEGLVEITPNKGAVVVGVSAEDLIDIYRIRMGLEGIAASMAAKRISDEEKAQLRESIELSEFYLVKRDFDHLKELDTDFHNIIYRSSGSRHIYKILSDLHRNIRAYRKLSLSVPSRLEHSLAEHREILGAIERGDAEAAEKLTCKHIEAALNNLISTLKP
jgi:DNA-binding GntR family transcriptional regulator